MKKFQIALLIAVSVCLILVVAVAAQSNQLTLKLTRDFGYGGFNGDIQGLFTLHVTGPADLAKVSFFIDTTVIGVVEKAPFNLQFTTDNYPLGVHNLHAVGTSSAGQEYNSNVVQAQFVPASSASKTILPIVGVLLAIIVVSTLVPLVLTRRAKKYPAGAERNYGAGGGGICPRCGRPFPLPLLAAHIGLSKLVVCPYCRKLSLVRVQPLEKLREAERAELAGGQAQIVEESEAEKLKKEMDDSKYQGF